MKKINNSPLWLLYVVIFLLALSVLCGCATQREVRTEYIERYHNDTLRQTQVYRDSVYVRDSVAVIQRGDTIYITKVKNLYRYLTRTDTVYKVKTDTVSEVKMREVSKPLNVWQKMEMNIGGVLIFAVVLVVLISGVRILIRRWKQSH